MNFLLIRTLKTAAGYYFVAFGLLFNVFAGGMITFNRSPVLIDQPLPQLFLHTVSVALHDPALCSRQFAGHTFNWKGRQEFAYDLRDGTRIASGRDLPEHQMRIERLYFDGKYPSQPGQTKEGTYIHQVPVVLRAKGDGNLPLSLLNNIYFEVDRDDRITRCLGSNSSLAAAREVKCLSAAGHLEKDGSCVLPVSLNSDCRLMGGHMIEGQETHCRVPASSERILARVVPTETKYARCEQNEEFKKVSCLAGTRRCTPKTECAKIGRVPSSLILPEDSL